MTESSALPILITFDGEARSGKGTVVQAVKDALRDEHGYSVMLIDGGQVFRCLVVAATKQGIDLDDAAQLDAFLSDEDSAEACVKFVKDVYNMEKTERDAMLYTSEVGVNSAKVGARPLAQSFKDMLLKKWLRDARAEGFDIVLLDGRALDEVGAMLEQDGLCRIGAGFYFVCDSDVGARRTLGFASTPYDQLDGSSKSDVDQLMLQIDARNAADAKRQVQPIVRPQDPNPILLPQDVINNATRATRLVDTSANMSKDAMSRPIISYLARVLATK